MGATTINSFEAFEQQFLEVIAELKTLNNSEAHLQEFLKEQCSRAEQAEAARDAALKAAEAARTDAAATTACVEQTSTALANAQEELNTTKMHLAVSERQRVLAEEKLAEMSNQLNSFERELQQLRPLKSSHIKLHRQYVELQEHVRAATEEAQMEVSRLESELRRVERSAAAGTELRERARLAAASHAREKRLADAELRHTSLELLSANAEIARLSIALTESQRRNSINERPGFIKDEGLQSECYTELRAALEAERSGAAKLEKALATALADNAALAAMVAATDNNPNDVKPPPSPELLPANDKKSALDYFLDD